jgi:hypothetical protein
VTVIQIPRVSERARGTQGDRLLRGVQNRRIKELRRFGMIESDPLVGVRPEEAMGELLENAMGYYRWVRSLTEEWDQDDFWIIDPRTKEKVPCAEFELEQRLFNSIRAVAGDMIRFDLDERAVVVEEAKYAILERALLAAAEAAGLDGAQKRKLGAELRKQVPLIESGRA